MHLLIAGGAGFIGSHLVEHFQERATEIRVLDNLRTGKRTNLDGLHHTFINGSIEDPATLERALDGIDLVFNLAALISVPESIEQPLSCVQINTVGHLRLLEAAVRAGCRKVILASSAAVYGDTDHLPLVESLPPRPQSPYAMTKLDGEFYNDLFTRTGRIPTASLRFFNVFGLRQDPQSAYAAVVPAFISRALRHDPLIIHGDGLQTRDFVYVKDIVAALAHVALDADATGVFNVGYGRATTVRDLAQTILDLTHSPSTLDFHPTRPGDIRHSVTSAERLKATGWTPQYTVESGLAETLQTGGN